MIHELTLAAVKRKLYDFDHIPRFINCKEICCALGMAYKQAGLKLPELTVGSDVMEALATLVPPIQNSPRVEECLKETLTSYNKLGESMDADALTTLRLGYEAGVFVETKTLLAK